MFASSAPAATGQITRADATADWSQGSVAGSVAGLPPPALYLFGSAAMAFVVPNSFVCDAQNLPGYFPSSPYDGAIRLIWMGGDESFDLPNVPLYKGISPRICLYATHKNLTLPGVWNATLLASRFFTAPATVVTLSRATALSKARSALKKRFGKAYKRGKRKRLSCAKRSSTRHRCTYSFRYRQKRQKGTVTVAIKPDGSFMTRSSAARSPSSARELLARVDIEPGGPAMFSSVVERFGAD